MDTTLRLVEGSKVIVQINLRQSGQAYDLTGRTVTFFLCDDRTTPKGSANIVDGAAVSVVGAATDGVVQYTLDSADTDFTGDTFTGKFGVLIADASESIYVVAGNVLIYRNPFIT